MKRALLALLALVALAGCDPPSQADPARYGEDAPTELDLAEYRRTHPDAGAP